MKIHYLQHVPFEGIGAIDEWINKNGHNLSCTEFYEGQKLPAHDSIDALIIMGGPMGVYDDEIYPYLKEEKEFIAAAIKKNKKVIGICLGAQLIASALGEKVYKNNYKEIGWFSVKKISTIKSNQIINIFPDTLKVFHWHGDTFNIPAGADLFYSSEACKNQSFIYGINVLALQFHIESNMESVGLLISNCGNELVPSDYIQDKEIILENTKKHSQEANEILFKVLDLFFSR